MKNILFSIGAAAFIATLCAADLQAAETNATPARIGIYDSRAVAFAWFWSGKHQKQLNELMQNARAAKADGDTNRFEKLAASLREQQDQIHREGFSTAPPTEALAGLKERLPEIQKAAGVAALVSKWDDAALKKYSDAEKVDVTGTLVREFITPTPQQQKTISGLEKATPLPLDECNELIRKGKI
jgi:HAMP domain-containing protein